MQQRNVRHPDARLVADPVSRADARTVSDGPSQPPGYHGRWPPYKQQTYVVCPINRR